MCVSPEDCEYVCVYVCMFPCIYVLLQVLRQRVQTLHLSMYICQCVIVYVCV